MNLPALIATLASMTLTASASVAAIPEVGSNGDLAAVLAVPTFGLIVWERRRRA